MFGVFLVTDVDGLVQYVSTTNLFMDEELQQCLVKQGTSKVHKIRAQSFSVGNEVAANAYRSELLRQLGGTPPGNTEGPDGWGIQGTSEQKSMMGVKSTGAKATPNALRESISRERSNFAEKEVNYGSLPVESPFEAGGAAQTMVGRPVADLDLTVDNVNKVLDQVRPYLINDGGNVAVVSVDDSSRDITLRLQGACGSCPSATTTMKMGIERVLRENFSNVRDVIAAPPGELDLSVEAVEEKVKNILPAVRKLGGIVEIRSVDSTTGKVVIGYKGPPKLIQGLMVIVKELDAVSEIVVDDIL